MSDNARDDIINKNLLKTFSHHFFAGFFQIKFREFFFKYCLQITTKLTGFRNMSQYTSIHIYIYIWNIYINPLNFFELHLREKILSLKYFIDVFVSNYDRFFKSSLRFKLNKIFSYISKKKKHRNILMISYWPLTIETRRNSITFLTAYRRLKYD